MHSLQTINPLPQPSPLATFLFLVFLWCPGQRWHRSVSQSGIQCCLRRLSTRVCQGTTSVLPQPLVCPLPHPGCSPRLLYRVPLPTLVTQHSFQQRQTSLEKGLDTPAHSLCSTKGAVSETLHQLAGQAPLCPLELLPVRQPDGQGEDQGCGPSPPCGER